jgi:hypothetical protein
MSFGVIERRRYDEQTQPVTWHVPLPLFQQLLTAANNCQPKRTAADLLNERIATPGLSILGTDVRRVVIEYSKLDRTAPDTLIAEIVRAWAENQDRVRRQEA